MFLLSRTKTVNRYCPKILTPVSIVVTIKATPSLSRADDMESIHVLDYNPETPGWSPNIIKILTPVSIVVTIKAKPSLSRADDMESIHVLDYNPETPGWSPNIIKILYS
ncbi:hypothetical protein RRG08_052645, partial [Elysia crispata]